MPSRTPNQAPSADHHSATIFVALELSKSTWLVALHTPLGDKISRHRLAAGDARGLLTLIAERRARIATALGRPVRVLSCYEAGRDGLWLHRLLEQHDVHNHVLDPASLLVNRRARRAKTDRIDLEDLLRALMALARGEARVASVVRVPSVAEEDARRLHRERHRLVAERVRHVNRIKGLLAAQGVHDFDPRHAERRARLGALITGDGRPLPPRLAAELSRELGRLELVLAMIEEVEAERDAIAAAKASAPAVPLTAAHPAAAKIRSLARLKGIGPEFATVLTGEVFYRAFDNRRQVAAYVGLDPSPCQSGARERDQGIAKAGNPKARTTMPACGRRSRTGGIELAWMWLRHQPQSRLAAWFRERVGTRRGRPRRIAVVALARKLLVALWRYVETGLVPEGAVLKA